MILYQWRGAAPNFGDELNALLWPRLLPKFFDRSSDTIFLGIGSVLDARHDPLAIKLVAGSGYGGYEAPATLDASWMIHWVRGPRTARGLGLPGALGLGDPASLLPLAGFMPARDGRGIGFMPHFESAIRGAWPEACAAAGVFPIDPRGDPLAIVAAIGRCRVLISEALHGIIVADALRVPWIAMRPLAAIHRAKWIDWAESLDVAIEFHGLAPSTALERAHLTPLARYHAGRSILRRRAGLLYGIARNRHIEQAAHALRIAAAAAPQLSRRAMLDQAQSRMMEAIAALRRTPMAGWGFQPGRAIA
jgi:succinoglycan biosynthesis protein ExoV